MENLKVVAVRKNEKGTIEEFKLSNGEIVDIETVSQYIDEGKMPNYAALESRLGNLYIRSDANHSDDDNLDNLPEF